MTDKKTTHRKDITVWVERGGVSLDVTYDCTFTISLSESQPGLADRKVEWDNVVPIHVSYSDTDDDERSWQHYGDNMPRQITNALETFSSLISASSPTASKDSDDQDTLSDALPPALRLAFLHQPIHVRIVYNGAGDDGLVRRFSPCTSPSRTTTTRTCPAGSPSTSTTETTSRTTGTPLPDIKQSRARIIVDVAAKHDINAIYRELGDILCSRHPGWEINDGGSGRIRLPRRRHSATHEHCHQRHGHHRRGAALLMHPYHHALSSAKFGGRPDPTTWTSTPGSTRPKPSWATAATVPATPHRRHLLVRGEVRHRSPTSAKAGHARAVPTRLIAEQHVMEDMGFLPTPSGGSAT
jgi:hypothetical protein